jgi:hypothetical protein
LLSRIKTGDLINIRFQGLNCFEVNFSKGECPRNTRRCSPLRLCNWPAIIFRHISDEASIDRSLVAQQPIEALLSRLREPSLLIPDITLLSFVNERIVLISPLTSRLLALCVLPGPTSRIVRPWRLYQSTPRRPSSTICQPLLTSGNAKLFIINISNKYMRDNATQPTAAVVFQDRPPAPSKNIPSQLDYSSPSPISTRCITQGQSGLKARCQDDDDNIASA